MNVDQAEDRTAVEIRQRVSVTYDFPVIFTRNAFSPENAALADAIVRDGPGPVRMAAVVDDGAARALPNLCERITAYSEAHNKALHMAGPPLVLPGGERAKADGAVLNAVLDLIYRRGLCRQSCLLVLGGGALLDAAGFAAATAHRGVRLVRMPSTTLAQNDAGVGVKNGVNLFGRKNFWGAFAPPHAVVNDFALLSGLAARDRRAGLSEAVKVALIRDRNYFDRLYALRERLGALESGPLEESIVQCARLHMEHIATSGDPFEFGSARPLDFGHWSAHALEELTAGELRHGEAVAIGIAMDSLYSWLAGLLPEPDARRIIELLQSLGFTLWHPAMEALDAAAALEAFREHLGGILHISLLQEIGRGLEVNAIDAALMARAKDMLRESV